MMEPTVLNKYTDTIPMDAVYVGRPSSFGNPFKVGQHGNRGECIELYVKWINLTAQEELRDRMYKELRGKDLVCYCTPKACHADIILGIVNSNV